MAHQNSTGTLEPLFDDADIEARYRKSKGWARRARLNGTGPRFIKIGRKPYYTPTLLAEYEADNTFASTSEKGSA